MRAFFQVKQKELKSMSSRKSCLTLAENMPSTSLFVILSNLSNLCLGLPLYLESESCSIVSSSLWPHGIYSPWNSPGQILEWVAFPFSRGSSQPRDQTQVSHIAGGFFTSWVTREALGTVSKTTLHTALDQNLDSSTHLASLILISSSIKREKQSFQPHSVAGMTEF